MSDIMNRKLMNPEETAQYFGLSKKALYMRVQRGDIPYIKIGNSLRFDPEMIIRYVEEKTISPFRARGGSRQ